MHNAVRVIHLDIKPDNIFVDKYGTVKIGDFGVSEFLKNKTFFMTAPRGTKLYNAPETWSRKSFKAKPLDVWALGVTFLQLALGRFPFVNTTNYSKFREEIDKFR